MRPGQVSWLGLRPQRRATMLVVDSVALEPASGVVGDRYEGKRGTRQVSLIGAEQLAAIGAFLGRDPADPGLLRRNIVTRGINLLALKERRFALGTALLEWTGECHPCSRMEELLGPGGYNAVRGQGGILARVLVPGRVALNGCITRLDDDATAAILPA